MLTGAVLVDVVPVLGIFAGSTTEVGSCAARVVVVAVPVGTRVPVLAGRPVTVPVAVSVPLDVNDPGPGTMDGSVTGRVTERLVGTEIGGVVGIDTGSELSRETEVGKVMGIDTGSDVSMETEVGKVMGRLTEVDPRMVLTRLLTIPPIPPSLAVVVEVCAGGVGVDVEESRNGSVTERDIPIPIPPSVVLVAVEVGGAVVTSVLVGVVVLPPPRFSDIAIPPADVVVDVGDGDTTIGPSVVPVGAATSTSDVVVDVVVVGGGPMPSVILRPIPPASVVVVVVGAPTAAGSVVDVASIGETVIVIGAGASVVPLEKGICRFTSLGRDLGRGKPGSAKQMVTRQASAAREMVRTILAICIEY
jgi:hypothetical protein